MDSNRSGGVGNLHGKHHYGTHLYAVRERIWRTQGEHNGKDQRFDLQKRVRGWGEGGSVDKIVLHIILEPSNCFYADK